MTRQLRILTAASLVATALLSALWTVLEPAVFVDPADRLAAIAEAGTAATVSGLMFALAQLPFAVGLVGLAWWLRSSSRRLAIAGAVLAVVGAFGHTVWAGVMLLQVVMADDTPNRAVHAAVLTEADASPVFLPFIIAGLAGIVLGVLLLSIALWRSSREPRWVAPALWAFLLVEFVGTSFSDWASYASGLLYVAAFVALAVRIATGSGDPEAAGESSSAGVLFR